MNPVSLLNEWVQVGRHPNPEFCIPKSIGPSHDTRFLCVWKFNGRYSKGVFAKNKKEGKALSAKLLLQDVGAIKNECDQVFREVHIGSNSLILVLKDSIDEFVTKYLEAQPSSLISEGITEDGDISPKFNHLQNISTGSLLINLLTKPTTTHPTASPTSTPIQDPQISSTSMLKSPHATNPISALHELGQRMMVVPTFEVISQTGPSHLPEFTARCKFGEVSATVKANSKQDVKYKAYAKVLEIVEGDSSFTETLSTSSSPVSLDLCEKNPISELMELCCKLSLQPEFHIKQVSLLPLQFECKCLLGDLVMEPVFGKNKKEAKTLAAVKALQHLKNKEEGCASDELIDERRSLSISSADLRAVDGYKGTPVNDSPLSVVMDESINIQSDISSSGSACALRQVTSPISALHELGQTTVENPKFELIGQTGPSHLPEYALSTAEPTQANSKMDDKNLVTIGALTELKANIDSSGSLEAERLLIETSGSSEKSAILSNAEKVNAPQAVQSLLNSRNPISTFYEYAQKYRLSASIEQVGVEGVQHSPSFTFKCIVDGRDYPSAKGRTKKLAQLHAAELALSEIYGLEQTQESPRSTNQSIYSNESVNSVSNTQTATENSLPDTTTPALNSASNLSTNQLQIESSVLQQFEDLKNRIPVQLGKVIQAGIVVEQESDSASTFTTVSIGAGSTVISGSNLLVDGTCVFDCHAEVIARRGLLRFLYDNLLKYPPSSLLSLFDTTDDGKFRMKETNKFHLYISSAPCGDSAVYSQSGSINQQPGCVGSEDHRPDLTKANYGHLRNIQEDEDTLPTKEKIQTLDSIKSGCGFVTMSCSDKICKWNVMGLQGTLLSQFIEPIYLHSIVIGQPLQSGHLCRALCCRVGTLGDQLLYEKSVYKLNHPDILMTGIKTERCVTNSSKIGLAWAYQDEDPELLDGSTGLLVAAQSARCPQYSRICKTSLYEKFKMLCKTFSTESAIKSSYNETKEGIQEYTNLKERLYQTFFTNRCGLWIRKPIELCIFG